MPTVLSLGVKRRLLELSQAESRSPPDPNNWPGVAPLGGEQSRGKGEKSPVDVRTHNKDCRCLLVLGFSWGNSTVKWVGGDHVKGHSSTGHRPWASAHITSVCLDSRALCLLPRLFQPHSDTPRGISQGLVESRVDGTPGITN
ncbi:hypothetical protein RRG08_044287 [Elysia crispata]|uniref:Uncharacterized protein n=1 Tax=Elysia crispata TaxID=231223 RepID=A0AAE1CP38_9GAST|nr:hypothetical protein RRG08_044287 [Elysia crispata]